MATSDMISAEAGKTWLGHPRGLYLLFFAEMWERFSYYGMRAILIFYLTKHFLFGEDKAYLLYGAYTSLVYITPVIGGYLADRFLGPRKAVLVGGVFIAIGHFLIAITEGPGGQDPLFLNGFYLALASIIVGTGFLKANISVLVGELYARDDHRRDPAFSIFYMGINMGGMLGPVVCGLLGELWGWSWGFGAAGVGMLAGLVMFVWLKPWLLGKGEPPAPQQLRARTATGLSQEWTIYLAAALGVAAIWLVIRYAELLGYALLGFSALTVVYIVWRTVGTLGKVDRDRMFAALFLIALNPLFWGLFEQAGGSLNLYTDRFVDRQGVPASLFQSINPIYIVLMGPIFAALWVWLGKKGWEPSAPAKFGLALAQVGLSFLIFVWGAQSVGMAALTPVFFVFAIYFFQTTGELCLSPVGLSAMNRLAPRHLGSLIMGAWFYMTAVGNFVAGKIGEATGGHDGAMTKEGTLAVYNSIGWITIGVAVAVLAVSPFIKRLMHLDTLKDVDPTPDPRPEEGLRPTTGN